MHNRMQNSKVKKEELTGDLRKLKSHAICTLHQILLEQSNHGG
jgi:hypothetical protein